MEVWRKANAPRNSHARDGEDVWERRGSVVFALFVSTCPVLQSPLLAPHVSWFFFALLTLSFFFQDQNVTSSGQARYRTK